MALTIGKRMRGLAIPAVAAAAGLGLGVGGTLLLGGSDAADAAPETTAATTTQTLTASLQTLEQSVSTSGTLAAVTSGTVAFEASGKVTAVNVTEGDVVAEGDVLAEIDTLALTAALREAESSLAGAQADLADLEDADDGSDAAEARIAAAESTVAVRETAVADAQADMASAQLIAPIAGLVVSQPYELGDAVSGGSSSSGSGSAGAGGAAMGGTSASSASSSGSGIEIVGQDQWTVSVSLSESEVALIAEGNQVTFTADDVDTFYGIVTEISNLPSTTGGSATYAVTLTVTGAPEGLFEGVSVDVSIVYYRRVDVLSLPTNAITTDADGVSTVTLLADDGSTSTVEVTLGEAIGSYTEILTGLAEGDQVQVTQVTQSGGDSSGMFPSGDFPFSDGEIPWGDGTGQMPGGGSFPGGQFPGQEDQ